MSKVTAVALFKWQKFNTISQFYICAMCIRVLFFRLTFRDMQTAWFFRQFKYGWSFTWKYFTNSKQAQNKLINFFIAFGAEPFQISKGMWIRVSGGSGMQLWRITVPVQIFETFGIEIEILLERKFWYR